MRNRIYIAILGISLAVVGYIGLGTNSANAENYCTTVAKCKAEVSALVKSQDRAARSGGQWGPVGPSACAIASSEQEGNERRCRAYDNKPGGKTWDECAKCYRQVREDLARWKQCAAKRLAPQPPRAIYESLARLGRQAQKG